jgi:hypothetical protein
MPAVYDNLQSGTVSDNPLLFDATTINSAAFANLRAVTAPDFLWITLDPEGANGAPEIVKVTANTAAATSVTVEREQQSTTAREHPTATVWAHTLTEEDANDLPHVILTTAGDIMYATAANDPERLAIGTADQVLQVNAGATAPEWGQVATDGIADSAVTTAKIGDSQVTNAKMADDSVDSAEIVDGAVDAVHLASGVARSNLAPSVFRRAANQSIASSASRTAISWDTEDQDTDGWATVTTDTLTCPATGVYLVVAEVDWASDPGNYDVIIVRNSETLNLTGKFPDATNARVGAFVAQWFTTSDTFQVQATQSSGGAINLTAKLYIQRLY